MFKGIKAKSCVILLGILLCIGSRDLYAIDLKVYNQAKIEIILAEECVQLDKAKILSLILSTFSDVLEMDLEKDDVLLKVIAGVCKRADFDNVEEEKAVQAMDSIYRAAMDGAPLEFLDDIFDISYKVDVSAEQLKAAALGLKEFSNSEVPEDIYKEFIWHSLIEQWEPFAIPTLVRGLIYGVEKGLSPEKVALTIIIDVDQGLLKDKDPDALVLESIKLVRESEPEKWRPLSQIEKSIAEENKKYKAIDKEINEKKLKDDNKKELRVLEQRKEDIDKRIAKFYKILEEDKKKKKAEFKRKEKEKVEKIIEKTKEKKQSNITVERIKEVVNDYLGVPYKFGGTTRAGIDCSAFTRLVYRFLGIELPRNSRAQAKVGFKVNRDSLRIGDLIFFDTSIYYNISHVGIYLGNGLFAHSCSSKGVTISHLNKPYFAKRYVLAKRLFTA